MGERMQYLEDWKMACIHHSTSLIAWLFAVMIIAGSWGDSHYAFKVAFILSITLMAVTQYVIIRSRVRMIRCGRAIERMKNLNLVLGDTLQRISKRENEV